MRTFRNFLLLFAAMVLTTAVRAQVLNGDLNHNNQLDVEDITMLINGYLTGDEEWFNANPPNHEAVDLGLSVKWATMNVGASSPEDYGDYFAWGETKPKDTYDWATYTLCKGSSDTMTKYCTNSSYGTVDNKTVLDMEDDAAHTYWGGTWRMPTDAEWTELKTKCKWNWTTQGGVYGHMLIGPNGNSIFLPAAGHYEYYSLHGTNLNGYYWSGLLTESNPLDAWSIDFDWRGVWGIFGNYRCSGQSVRAVCP
ncbi:MAG: hypothetical protein IJT97_07200 [Bacteroidaceae bacterium]|nr:hypothetical protein [Bacteroidaceae bacterium]